MGALDELRAKLVTDGVGAKGASTSTTSIFVDSLPEWDGISIVLVSAQAAPGDRHYGDGVPTIERPTVEMLVRSTAPTAGQVPKSTGVKAAAEAAYRSLVTVANQTLAASSSAAPSTWLNVDAPNGQPYLMDRDPQGRIYYRCLFACDRMSTS